MRLWVVVRHKLSEEMPPESEVREVFGPFDSGNLALVFAVAKDIADDGSYTVHELEAAP